MVSSLASPEPLAIKVFNSLSNAQQEELSAKKTIHGVDIAKVLKSGIENPDSEIGCYAGDAQSYTDFAPIFNGVVKHYHNVNLQQDNKKDTNIDGVSKFSKPIAGKIISTRIRVARSLSEYLLHLL